MRFVKLRLNGFKSFVDPTDLMISDGLTGVVGPNGCGKSNLLEALRWVMGENRPTAMRGGGMEDVIFAGAATRPARNFAEVSLSIDNGERLAPAGFNDLDTLDIIRRITRDAGSAYKANGKDVRARDVQMLFADASTGAHSPALVRQGQIAELINAKPKARRRILEEAAGISGLYQRRHEAELKLKGAETNLARLEDVLEQLASQLASLARQARQAARYREIGEALRQAEGLLLYRHWREAQIAQQGAEEALRSAMTGAAQAEGAARQATKAREEADGALPPLREEEAIAQAILQRLRVERETLEAQEHQATAQIDRLSGRIVQLTADADREDTLRRDAGETIERLDWELDQLAKASEGHEDRLDQAMEAAQDAARVLQDRETALGELTEDLARLAARHQSAERLRDDTVKLLSRAEGEAEAATAAKAQAEAQVSAASDSLALAEAANTDAQAAAVTAEEDLTQAEAQRTAAQAAETAARGRRAEADGAAGALRAEVAALAKLVAREAGEQDMLLDRVRVQPGYEAALGAALSDELRAAEVSGDQGSGWVSLSPLPSDQALPAGATPLSQMVEVPGVLRRRMSQIGLVDPAQGSALQGALLPGQRLVSLAGDLWRWDGYRASAEDAPSSAALRLTQMNRLASLRADLDDADAALAAAESDHDGAASALAAATEADTAARAARRAADQAVADAARQLSRAEAERNIAAGKVESLALAAARAEDEATRARAQLAEVEGTLAELPDLTAARAEIEDARLTVEASRVTMLSKRSAHDEVRREGEARTKRRQEVTKEVSGWRHRLETAGARIAELKQRRDETEEELTAARNLPGQIADKRGDLQGQIEAAEVRSAQASDRFVAAETALRSAAAAEREAERRASEAREGRAATEARAEAARDAEVAARTRIADEHGASPDTLLERLDVVPDDIPPSGQLETKVDQLKRQRDALGAVNLRAEEDAREVQQEHDALNTEKTDLEAAIAKLRTGIAGLNREGRERLLTAFEEVNRNFSTLFTHLFGGGEANLLLVESDDPLEAGLEIMCQPPGKKLSTLSLLSGGEQTLTALALIFAVFLANPAPICVLDEVDAPLDDANVTRFCDLLDEMARRTDTRFLIITHHAVTMARMDRLFGVTMGEQGVSQLVSVDLKKAEALVA